MKVVQHVGIKVNDMKKYIPANASQGGDVLLIDLACAYDIPGIMYLWQDDDYSLIYTKDEGIPTLLLESFTFEDDGWPYHIQITFDDWDAGIKFIQNDLSLEIDFNNNFIADEEE